MSDPVTEESRYASRKFILAVMALTMAFLLLLGDFIAAAGFLDLVKWTLGLYFTANVGQKAAQAIADAPTPTKEQ